MSVKWYIACAFVSDWGKSNNTHTSKTTQYQGNRYRCSLDYRAGVSPPRVLRFVVWPGDSDDVRASGNVEGPSEEAAACARK